MLASQTVKMRKNNMGYLRIAVTVLVAAGLLAAVGPASASITVGGFAGSRVLFGGYSVYNPSGANTELTDPANAALYGDTIVFAPSTTTVDDAYLSTVDIFFTGLLNFNAAQLTAPEITSLVNFINNGGLVIAHGDNTSFSETVDGLLNVFGLDVNGATNNGGPTNVNITDPGHPVMNGPFGVVDVHAITDSAFLLPASGPGEVIAFYEGGGQGAVGIVGPDVPGRLGGLVFFPDSESYGLSEPDFRGLVEAERAFNNAVAWVSALRDPGTPGEVPEPATLLVWSSLSLAAGCFAWRKYGR
jgi:hypothetical protein